MSLVQRRYLQDSEKSETIDLRILLEICVARRILWRLFRPGVPDHGQDLVASFPSAPRRGEPVFIGFGIEELSRLVIARNPREGTQCSKSTSADQGAGEDGVVLWQ